MGIGMTFVRVTQLGQGTEQVQGTKTLSIPFQPQSFYPAPRAGASHWRQLLILWSPAIKRQQNGKIIKK